MLQVPEQWSDVCLFLFEDVNINQDVVHDLRESKANDDLIEAFLG